MTSPQFMPPPSLIARIDSASRNLPPSEARVAQAVLVDPGLAVTLSIAAIAKAADVSEPTVARFCKSLGFSGFREFKLALAYSIAGGVPFVHGDVAPDDGVPDIADKVLNRAISSFSILRDQLDSVRIEEAIALIIAARRLDFFGQGNSGIVALDAQHKFFRLGFATNAYADPHVHSMAAALLGLQDVVVAISAGGRTLDLIRSVEIARDAGAKVIAITVGGSPLARASDLVIATDLFEDQDIYSPMISRLSHLALIDVLAVGTAIRLGPEVARGLEKAKAAVREKRAGHQRRPVKPA
jgi:RpiR family transcriptional regulator, carbohydrate utilization regulator